MNNASVEKNEYKMQWLSKYLVQVICRMKASGWRHLDCVQLLLDAGANKDLQDSFGQTALMAATLNGHRDCVKLLLDAGAKKDLKNKDTATALFWAQTQEIGDLF